MLGAGRELPGKCRTKRTTGARGQGLRCPVTEELCKESCSAPVHSVPGLKKKTTTMITMTFIWKDSTLGQAERKKKKKEKEKVVLRKEVAIMILFFFN